jgi:hypothetical protein
MGDNLVESMGTHLVGWQSCVEHFGTADLQTPYRAEQLAAGGWTPVYELKLGHP